MTPSILVFVVEDHIPIRIVLEEALTDGGFAVITADSGEEAIKMLDASGATFRALVTDVNFPGQLSGWDVARHARQINAHLPVIYATGASAHHWASEGVPNSLLLTKPFAIAQVVAAVSQLINAAAVSDYDG